MTTGISDKMRKFHQFDLVVLNMKFSFFTLGCKVNQYETQAMEQLLLQRGHSLGRFD